MPHEEFSMRDATAELDRLLDETYSEMALCIAAIRTSGKEAFDDLDLVRVRLVQMDAERVMAFQQRLTQVTDEWQALRTRIDDLHKEWWDHLLLNTGDQGDAEVPVTQDLLRPLTALAGASDESEQTPKIVRAPGNTSVADYERPLLRALCELGGQGEVRKVREKVLQLMWEVLREGDFYRINPPEYHPRWESNLDNARNFLVRSGFMKQDSPHGIWEISEAGRQRLAEQA
jgi:hypothetical protein